MANVPSAVTWGLPSATKYALLIHGLSATSHTWHRVASSLAVQGYFVVAPNLIGHASRVATDYSLGAIAEDLRPYLTMRNYSLIIGHSLGAITVLALFQHLSPSHPTAIVLVDPPLQASPERIRFVESEFADSCVNVESVGVVKARYPLWTREDCVYSELGKRLCSPDAVHAIFQQNTPWYYFDRLHAVSEKWKVTVLVADPTIYELCPVEDIHPYPHIRPVMVPGAGHSIQSEFPEVIVEEALKTVAGLEEA